MDSRVRFMHTTLIFGHKRGFDILNFERRLFLRFLKTKNISFLVERAHIMFQEMFKLPFKLNKYVTELQQEAFNEISLPISQNKRKKLSELHRIISNCAGI